MNRRTLAMSLTAGLLGAPAVRAQAPSPSASIFPAAPPPDLPYKPVAVRAPDGVRLAAQEWGNPAGPEIVLVHGVLQSHLSFARQVSGDLAREFRIVTYDLRGHGASDKPGEAEAYLDGRRWADDLKAVMDAAGLRRPVLGGWSLGGVIMCNYLKAHGDGALAGLHFVDAVVKRGPDVAGDPATRPLLPNAASPDLRTRLDGLNGFLRACFERQPAAEDFERMLAAQVEVPRPVLGHILRGIPLDAEADLRRVRVPTLVTFGARDRLISPRMAEVTREWVPHARVSIHDGIGHAPFYEDAARFDVELATFAREAGRR